MEGESMSEWKEVKLEEILIIYDKKRRPLSSIQRSSFQGQYRYYGAQGIIDYIADYIFDGEYMLIAEDGENLNSRTQPIAQIVNGKFWVNNHAHIVRTNDKANMYLVMLILNNLNISSYVTGAAQPKLNQDNLKRISIYLPNKNEQDIIAGILSSLDAKIETNNKLNEKLEEMARDLRYLCDMDKTMLVKMLHTSPTCRFIEGRDAKEFERIVDAALSYKTICGYPQSVRMACKNCGIDLPYFGAGEIADDQDEIDYDFWASRLLPLLHPDNPRDIYARAVAKMDDKLKLGGVLVAGAMTGTYLTQCYFQHYDARLYRLSYLVYVIGPPASGKSFLADLDKVLMYAMKQQDETFRKMEKEYTEKKERNEQMKGAKETDIPSKPHVPIRYVPSTISNKVLYNRLTDAVTSDSPEAMHLHLFTTETELATALRVQVGSWAGKLDLELKSFQNEWAGVDYADNGSANGLIQVNWNQCISSTQSSVIKKVRGGDLDDGFITRLALWLMPPTKGKMIDYKGDQPVEFDDIRLAPEDMDIVSMCIELSELTGRINCEPLVRAAWEWCDNQTDLAKLDNDECREYFRKRIPLYMIRYTLPRMVCMQYEEFKKTGTLVVTEEDKEFARLIGDWLMFASIRQWGNRLMTTWETKAEENKVREKSSPFADRYAQLPNPFTIDNILPLYSNKKSAQSAISVLVKKGLIKKVEKNVWQKLKNDIYDISNFK